ncbi:hypothetical protein CHS0354_032588 [Potamilus streckersoni]|uniref:Potassium channel domain-containing protein n=1 Tax=Potamilus streckersoni TaxID=2493646 RepID=A0AAE0W855_9BIVA|nr:hypothetical protein CHS0354_032588 [Potamilus streckersoni]
MGSKEGSKHQGRECCKTVMKAMFSHIGLCSMVILYTVAGGFIFEHLEKANEETICFEGRKEYIDMQNTTLASVKKVILASNLDTDAMMIQLASVLQTFRDNTLAIGYDGTDCDMYGEPDGPKYQWSWPGALMFAVTVITTIGYGHIAPKTFWGRLVCIAYAVLGIPLMLLCLANIGDVLADIFRFVYAKICCFGCCRNKKRDKNKNAVVQIKGGSQEPTENNNEKCKILSTSAPMDTEFSKKTVSFNEHNKKLFHPRPDSPPSIKPKIVPLDIKTLTPADLASRNRAIMNQQMMTDDESDDDDDDELDEKITVPLTITMVVIGVYIFGGSVLFGLWEDWDMLQSAYFCFITLSTIGFGDVVPGRDFEDPQAAAQLILGAVYVLFGMAIMSMCFALMQDEMVTKCKWLGQKLGIIDKEEDE